MAAKGHELATAYVAVVPSMAGVTGNIGKEFDGITQKLSKQVNHIPDLFDIAMSKVARTVDKSFQGVYKGMGDGLRSSTKLLGESLDYWGRIQARAKDSTRVVGEMPASLAYVNKKLEGVLVPMSKFTAGFKSSFAAGAAFTGKMGELGGQTRKVYDQLAGAVSKVGLTAVSAGKSFYEGFTTSTVPATGLIGSIGVMGSRLQSATSDMIMFGTVGAKYLKSLVTDSSLYKNVLGGTVDMLRDATAHHSAAFQMMIGNLASTVRGGIEVLDRFGMAGEAAFNLVKHHVGNVIQSLSGFASKVSTPLVSGFNSIRDSASKAITPIAGVAGGLKSTVVESRAFQATFGRLASGIQSFAGIHKTMIGNIREDLAKVAPVASAAFNKVREVGGQAFNSIKTVGSAALENVKARFPAVAEAGSRVFNKIKDAGGKMAASVIENSTKLAGRGIQAFGQFTSSVIQGSASLVSSVTSAMGRMVEGVADAFRGPATAAVVAGMAGIGIALKNGMARLDTIDVARAKMRGMGIEGERAAGIMKSAEAAVLDTMYGLDEAATIAAAAIAAGAKEGKDLDDTLKTVVNTSAATGRNLEEVGYIFNKVRSTGKAYTTQINQIAQSGIPMWENLGKVMNLSTDEVRKAVETGQVGFEEFRAAAELSTAGVAEAMGQTLPASIRNLGHFLSRAGANIWKGLEPEDNVYTGIYQKLAPLVIAFTKALKPLEASAAKIGDTLGRVLNPILEKLTDRLVKVREAYDKVSKPVETVSDAITRAGAMTEKAAGSFSDITEALKPFGAVLIALGVGGLGPLLQVFGRFRPLLGPLPMLFGAVGSSLGILTAGLAALAFVDPTKMADGFAAMAEKVPRYFNEMIPKIVSFGDRILPEFLQAITTNLPILVDGVAGIVTALATSFTARQDLLTRVFTDIFTGLADTITTLVPTLVTVFTDIIPMLASVIVGLIPVFITGVTELFSSIVMAAGQIIPAIVGMIAEVVLMIVDALESNIDVILDAAVTLFETIAKAIPIIIPALLTAITTVLPKIVDALVKVVPQIAAALVGAAPTLLDAGIQVFMALVNSISEIIPPLIEALVEMMPVLIQTLIDLIPVLMDGAIQLLYALVEALPVILPDIIAGIIEIVLMIGVTLLSMIPDLLYITLLLLAAIVEGIVKSIPIIIETMWNMAVSMVETLSEWISDFIQMGRDFIQGLIDGVLNMASTLWDKIKGFFQDLWDKIKDFFGISSPSKMFEDLAGNLIQGLIDGILGGAGKAVEAVLNLGGQVVSGIKGLFGVSSPSTVMAQIGGWLDEGIAEGLTGGSAAVDGMTELSDRILAPMDTLKVQFAGLSMEVATHVAAMIGSLLDLVGIIHGEFATIIQEELAGVADAFRTILPAAIQATVAAMMSVMNLFTSWAAGAFTTQITVALTQAAAAFSGLRNRVATELSATQRVMQTFTAWSNSGFASTMSRVLTTVAAAFVKLVSNVASATNSLRGNLQGFSSWFSGTLQSSIVNALNAMQTAFTRLPAAVASAWTGMRGSTARPTNYVIGTVYMQGIRAAVNAISNAVGLSLSMPSVSQVSYATGTAGPVLPGYSPGIDNYTFYNPRLGFLRLGGGEAILRPEVTKALGGAPTINSWNRSRGRNISRVGDRGYAEGGILDFLQNTASGGWNVLTSGANFLGSLIKNPLDSLKNLVVNPARAAISGVGGGEYGRKTGMTMVRVAEQMPAVMTEAIRKHSSSGIVAAARMALGTPYVWGGTSVPGGLDCSGLVYWALTQMGKTVPRLTAAGYKAASMPVDVPMPGDLAFWPGHVAIVSGNGTIIHAPQPGSVVSEVPIYGSPSYGRLLYDAGGWLMPGLTLAQNNSGEPEAVFTKKQLMDMFGPRDLHVRGTLDITEESKTNVSMWVLRETGLDLFDDQHIDSKVGKRR